MSWIISLGAGREQIPLIRAIQAEGYRCWAFDRKAWDRGADGAPDAFSLISNRDVSGILGEAATFPERISGVMAAASEVPDVMAILAHRLGLPGGLPVATGMLLKDKLRYKEVLKAAGVPHTEAYEVHGGSAKALFDRLGYEVVIKPRSGSGSRGVFINRHDPMSLSAQLADAVETVHADLIMERYQEGPQISYEALIWDGIAICVAFVDRFYAHDNHVPPKTPTMDIPKELGGSTPSEWVSEKPLATKVIQSAARALGITRGTIKADLVLTEAGPLIIELTARLSGGPLSWLVKESTGVDYLREAVKIATGEKPDVWDMSNYPSKKVAVDMSGNVISWDDTSKYVPKKLGAVKQ